MGEDNAEVISGLRGQTMFCLGGYVYSKKTTSANTIRWRCAQMKKLKCGGGVTTTNELPYSHPMNFTPHTHPPDESVKEVNKFRVHLLEAILTTEAKPVQVLATALQSTPDSVKANIGKIATVQRYIRKQRQLLLPPIPNAKLNKTNGTSGDGQSSIADKPCPPPAIATRIAALNKESSINEEGQSSAADNPRASSAVIEPTKSSGDATYIKTSSANTTTSATTTACTTSSFTTTSLTTVSVTTTFSTTTTPSSSISTSAYLPSTSGIETTIIKEELDVSSDEISFETELDQNNDRMDFEHTYNTQDQLESDYNQQYGNKRRRIVNNEGGDGDTSQDIKHIEAKEEDLGGDESQIGPDREESEIGPEREKSEIGPEREESEIGPDREESEIGPEREESEIGPEREDSHSRELSDILKSAESIDLRLQNILTDNVYDFCDINPTRLRNQTQIPSSRPSREPYSAATLKYLDLEQRLRVYYLKTMIQKEEELMNLKIEVNKTKLLKEKLDLKNIKEAQLVRMKNLNLENRLLKSRLQLMIV